MFTTDDIQQLYKQRIYSMTPEQERIGAHEYAVRVMALTMMGEARNQSILGRVGVGWTIYNRSLQKGRPVDAICFQKLQYSCWYRDSHTKNDEWVYDVAERLFKTREPLAPADAALYRECQYLAGGILTGVLRDPTKGSTHYITTALLAIHPPAWVDRPPVTTIEAHAFFAGIPWS